jgi:hypothetical protein
MDIRIERAAMNCHLCDKEFADGELKTVALSETEEEGRFRRQDICSGCWEMQNPESFVCHWLASHSLKRRPALLDADVLWQVLHAAAPTKDSPGEPEFAYVAALGLMRMRQLSLDGTERQEGRLVHVFNGKGGASKLRFKLRDPGLDESGIESVQDRLAEYAEDHSVTATLPTKPLTPTQQFALDRLEDPEVTRKVRPGNGNDK